MADVNRGNRPLSPFMFGQYYRPQWTSMSSILNRITGISLIVAAFMALWWIAALAAGPGVYATANGFITSWFGDLVLFLSVWALWYHSLAGIRHLIWDAGYGFEVKTAERMGQAAVAGATVLTILTALLV